MGHAFAVGPVEGVGNLDRDANGFIDGERTLRDAVGECLTFKVFHDKVVGIALVPDVVKRADVRMAEVRDDLSFAIETCLHVGIAHPLRRQNFDGHTTIQARVCCEIHLAHASGSDSREDFVRAETCTFGDSHVGRIMREMGDREQFGNGP